MRCLLIERWHSLVESGERRRKQVKRTKACSCSVAPRAVIEQLDKHGIIPPTLSSSERVTL